MQDYNCDDIEDNMHKLCKTLGTYKDFGKIFYEVWADAFYNYIIIFFSLFRKATPDFYAITADFYSYIYELSTIYKWQKAILPIDINAQIFIVTIYSF